MTEAMQRIRDVVVPILKRHGVSRAGVFGSCARGDATGDSDVDLVVELRDDIGLLDFITIKLEIEDAIGRTVDLVEYDAIKPLLRDRILRDQVPIL